jgi:hypothetical protein
MSAEKSGLFQVTYTVVHARKVRNTSQRQWLRRWPRPARRGRPALTPWPSTSSGRTFPGTLTARSAVLRLICGGSGAGIGGNAPLACGEAGVRGTPRTARSAAATACGAGTAAPSSVPAAACAFGPRRPGDTASEELFARANSSSLGGHCRDGDLVVTTRAAMLLTAGLAAGVSTGVVTLTEGVLRTMFIAKLKTATVLLCGVAAVSLA